METQGKMDGQVPETRPATTGTEVRQAAAAERVATLAMQYPVEAPIDAVNLALAARG